MELYIFIGAIISIGTISETKNGFIVVLDGIQGKNRKNVDVEASAFKSLADACYAVCDFFPNEMHNQIHFMYTDGQKSLEYTP